MIPGEPERSSLYTNEVLLQVCLEIDFVLRVRNCRALSIEDYLRKQGHKVSMIYFDWVLLKTYKISMFLSNMHFKVHIRLELLQANTALRHWSKSGGADW